MRHLELSITFISFIFSLLLFLPRKQTHFSPPSHRPLCPCNTQFSRLARPLVIPLEEVTLQGKKKLHYHKERSFKRQIITSGLRTVSDTGYKLENKRFCGLRSCRQDKSFKLQQDPC